MYTFLCYLLFFTEHAICMKLDICDSYPLLLLNHLGKNRTVSCFVDWLRSRTKLVISYWPCVFADKGCSKGKKESNNIICVYLLTMNKRI